MMKSLNRTPWYLICPAPFFKRFCYSLKNHLKELKERLFYEEEKSCAQLVCAIYTSLAEVYYFFVKGMGFKKADKRKRGITCKYSFFYCVSISSLRKISHGSLKTTILPNFVNSFYERLCFLRLIQVCFQPIRVA